MTTNTRSPRHSPPEPIASPELPRSHRRTATVLTALLGLALATNSLLGPLVGEVIRYHYGASMVNQAIGLDAVALLFATPLALVAAWLIHRDHPAGPVLALAPATFAAYMMPQYVVGPDYLGLPGNNEDFVLAHIAVFVLAVAVAVLAWRGIDRSRLLPGTVLSDRHRSWVLLGVAAFIALGRQLPAIAQVMADPAGNTTYQDNPTAFWLVAFLDLGLITPASVAGAIGLRRHTDWARTASYAVIGWFSLVPVSVAAMTIAMQLRDDPLASTAGMVLFSAAALVFTAGAVALYRPMFTRGLSA